MMKRIALVLLVLPIPVLAQSTVNKAQLRSQDQRTTERQLKDQLWSIFEPVDERRGKDRPAPRKPLDITWLSSRPYAAQVPGLCRMDSVMLHFAPSEDGTRTARTPVRAYGLDARPMYHFRMPPKGWHDDIADDERSPWDPECEGLDRRKQDFFGAPDEETATDGYYAMLLAARASASGKVKPECGVLPPVEKRSCAQVVADLAKATVTDVERCEPIPSAICYKITIGRDEAIRVAMNANNEVQSVEFEQMVVLWSERID